MKKAAFSLNLTKCLVIGVLLISIFIISLTGITIYQSRLQYEESANVTAQNLAKVLEEYISGIINKTDVALQSIVDEIHRQEADGGLRKQSLNMCMIRQRDRITELGTILMTNAKGEIAYGTKVAPGPLINVADRDYFIHFRNDAKGGVFI